MDRKIIITVLSPVKKPKDGGQPEIFSYASDCAEEIRTDWTNGAGLIYLLKTVPDCTNVICMCSDEVDNDEHKNKVRGIISSCGCENIEPVFIRYQTDTPLVDITSSLINNFTFKSSDIIFLDTTGGFRSVVYSLVYLFRYFEYMNIRIDKAIYSSLKEKQGKIEDIKNTFRMFDLINGTHEFTSSGNPQTLIAFFENNSNPKIASLLDNMTEFYDAISLCRLNHISSIVKKLRGTMNDLQHDEPKSFDEALFINLIPAIKEKFYSSGKFNYLSLIKWCLANNLLQQAVTIYVEKLPRAYFKQLNFLTIPISEDDLEKKSTNPGADVYVEYFMASTLDVKSNDHLSEMDRLVEDNLYFIKLYSPNRNFNKLFKGSDYSDECIEKFKMIVEIRDAFYDNRGVRVRYTQNDSQARKLLAKMNLKQLSMLPGTVDALLTFLKNSHYFLSLNGSVAGFDNAQNSRSLLNNYNRAVNGELSSEVTLGINKEALKKLRLDYLYAKYIRNQINHASELTDDEPVFKQLMSEKYGYSFPAGNNFSASEIRSFLRTSIQYIENIKYSRENL